MLACVLIIFVLPVGVALTRCRYYLLDLQESRAESWQINRAKLAVYTLAAMLTMLLVLSLPLLIDAVSDTGYPLFAGRVILTTMLTGGLALLLLVAGFWDRVLARMPRAKVVSFTFLVLHAALFVDLGLVKILEVLTT